MPSGRPKGMKNKASHSAGGASSIDQGFEKPQGFQ